MTNQMMIANTPVNIGEVSIYIHHYTDENGTHNSIDILSDSTNDEMGGVAINSLGIGNITTFQQLSGMTFSYNANDESSSELGESVFWQNADETLEIEQISIAFGALQDEMLQVKIQASCFKYAPHKDIDVTLVALAKIIVR